MLQHLQTYHVTLCQRHPLQAVQGLPAKDALVIADQTLTGSTVCRPATDAPGSVWQVSGLSRPSSLAVKLPCSASASFSGEVVPTSCPAQQFELVLCRSKYLIAAACEFFANVLFAFLV